MSQLIETQARLTPSWPASLSEILQIFGPLNDKEFRTIANLILLGGGVVKRNFNFPDFIYQKINQELRDSRIQYNINLNQWVSNSGEYSAEESNEKKNNILVNWRGSEFGKGLNSLYILIDNRCLSDLIIKKSVKHFIKIGKTHQKLKSRIKDLNTGNPFGVRPIVTLRLDNPNQLEKLLQNDLENYNVTSNYANNQEWFYVETETLIASIEKNLLMSEF